MVTAGVLVGALVVVGVAAYTVNYGRSAWAGGNRAGGAALFVLAALAVLIPAWVAFGR